MSDELRIEATMPDMDLGDAESQRPPSEGWHPAVLVEVFTAYTKDDMDLPEANRRRNYVLKPRLADDDPEMPNYKMLGYIYIPVPSPVEQDYNVKYKAATKESRLQMMQESPELHAADGRTKCAQKIAYIKKAAAVFGGKETGKFDKNFFVKKIGERFMVDLKHDISQGDLQARVKFMGIRPA